MSDRLRSWTAAPEAVEAIFSDAHAIALGLRYEAALAHALAAEGVIAPEAAARIAAACERLRVEPQALAAEAVHAGTLAIALIARLHAALGEDAEARAALHLGATSQDLADTLLVLQLADALTHLHAEIARCEAALADLAARHLDRPALGRTLLQDARPLSFGLRAAHWLRAVALARRRLTREAEGALRLQFGGAVGTCAGQDGKGRAIAAAMAEALGLPAPLAPWHNVRDGMAGLASALAILIGALGKIGRDIGLLAQTPVGEAREPVVAGRGGSSAMPHKRNQTAAQVALSAATRAPGLASSILSGLPQELERGLGGWQAEAPVLAELVLLASGAASAMAVALEGLDVDVDAIGRNLAEADVGTDIGESVALATAILDEYRGETSHVRA